MSQFEFSSDPAAQADPEARLNALERAHASLRTSFHVTLVLLLILSGALFASFLREVSIARQHIHDLTLVVGEYQKNSAPVIEDFRRKLHAFTQAHPDFAPIYNKYFTAPNTALPSQEWPQGPAVTNPSVRLPPKEN
jgi:hypothetical protein